MAGEVKSLLNSMRRHKRKAVILPAQIDVDGKYIDCTAYDVSLGGVRLKVDIPLNEDSCVLVMIRDKINQVAKVIWSSEGFVGLSFNANANEVKEGLGSFAMNLN